MNLCGTCKRWEPPKWAEYHELRIEPVGHYPGTCKKIVYVDQGIRWDGGPIASAEKAFTDYIVAQFKCLPDYGCVLHLDTHKVDGCK